MTLSKAYLLNLDFPKESVEVMFNPNQYTLSKSVNWTGGGMGTSADSPGLKFGGGEASTLTLELFFDTYHKSKTPGGAQDVRNKTQKIYKLMHKDSRIHDANSEHGRPAFVQFRWGKTWSFNAAIISITQKFTAFDSDGTPTRATLEVAFKQIKDEFQDSSSDSLLSVSGIGKIITAMSNMSPQEVAHIEYGNADFFGAILDANPKFKDRMFKVGDSINIPLESIVKSSTESLSKSLRSKFRV